MTAPQTSLHIRPRYARLFTDDDAAMLESNYIHQKLDWRLPLKETALICLDVWNTPPVFAGDTLARTAEIVSRRIVPLLSEARRAGMTVIHAPANPVARRHPNWVGRNRKAPRPSAPPAWPPPDFRAKRGIYTMYARPTEPLAAKQAWAREHHRAFHPDVRPVNNEPVVADGRELHRLCASRKLLHLFYLGFWANACMIGRNYGMPAMQARGYHTILLRDCTTGMEIRATYRNLTCTRGIIATLEQFQGYSITSPELIRTLNAVRRQETNV